MNALKNGRAHHGVGQAAIFETSHHVTFKFKLATFSSLFRGVRMAFVCTIPAEQHSLERKKA